MVLVSEKLKPKACRQFEAEIYLLYHSNGISKGLQATLHIQNVCQTANIYSMDKVSKPRLYFVFNNYFSRFFFYFT